jgi:hypothetical protein
LAFHLNAGQVVTKPGDVSHLNDYIEAMLDQIADLMLNLRYRFAFLRALRQPTDKIQLEQNGVIEESESNAKAITTALKSSSLADIQ